MTQVDEKTDRGPGAEARPIAYYDGSCPLCRREIAMLKRGDKAERIEFRDIAADASAGPSEVNCDVAMARFHVRRADGTLVSGANAFAALWREIPLTRPLGILVSLPVIGWLAEQSYRGFLKFRPLLQRLALRAERRGGREVSQTE